MSWAYTATRTKIHRIARSIFRLVRIFSRRTFSPNKRKGRVFRYITSTYVFCKKGFFRICLRSIWKRNPRGFVRYRHFCTIITVKRVLRENKNDTHNNMKSPWGDGFLAIVIITYTRFTGDWLPNNYSENSFRRTDDARTYASWMPVQRYYYH